MERISATPTERTSALQAMNFVRKSFREGHATDHAPDAATSCVQNISAGKSSGVALSQLDDYLHRGGHPILQGMSLYVYSQWVYRAERKPFAANAAGVADQTPRHIDIPFDDAYAAARTWVQRLAVEPRIPKPEGFSFITDIDPEMHYLLKSVLLRPIRLPQKQPEETNQLRMLRAYEALCTPTVDGESWSALSSGADSPGPFERGWQGFIEEQLGPASAGRAKCLSLCLGSWSHATLWNTQEVQEELEQNIDVAVESGSDELMDCPEAPVEFNKLPPALGKLNIDQATSSYPCRPLSATMMTVQEYYALETLATARNYDAIAKARAEKPTRQIQKDVLVQEQVVHTHSEGGGGHGDEAGQVRVFLNPCPLGISPAGLINNTCNIGRGYFANIHMQHMKSQ